MDKNYAHHLLLELIKKHGQHQHYDALISLYKPVEKFTEDNLPNKFFFQNVYYMKQSKHDYIYFTSTSKTTIDIYVLLLKINSSTDDIFIESDNNDGTHIPFKP